MSAAASAALVALGGAIGAVLRFWLGGMLLRLAGPGWPWGTLAANVLGGFAMGLLVGWLAARADGNGAALRLFLGVGLLGGFTTFSAFSLDLLGMLERRDLAGALLYAGVSVLASVVALAAGLALMRSP